VQECPLFSFAACEQEQQVVAATFPGDLRGGGPLYRQDIKTLTAGYKLANLLRLASLPREILPDRPWRVSKTAAG